MENKWHTYSTEAFLWEIRLPWRPHDPAYRNWQRQVLDSGEKHAVFRVRWVNEHSPVDYRRDRDGYLGDFLDAHPEALSPPSDPELRLFSSDVGMRGAARLAYVSTTDDICEHEVLYLPDLPDLKTQFGQHMDDKPPLQFMSDLDDDGALLIWLLSYSTIWLPWPPNDDLYDDLPDGALLDNRALAERHTPRLNAFLTDINNATEAVGGTMRLDLSDTWPEYVPLLTDHSVRMDRPAEPADVSRSTSGEPSS